MTLPAGIYRINGVDEYVVAAESGGMFMTSEILDADDIEELIAGNMDLIDYELSSERSRDVTNFTLVPYEKWAEIAGEEIDLSLERTTDFVT